MDMMWILNLHYFMFWEERDLWHETSTDIFENIKPKKYQPVTEQIKVLKIIDRVAANYSLKVYSVTKAFFFYPIYSEK